LWLINVTNRKNKRENNLPLVFITFPIPLTTVESRGFNEKTKKKPERFTFNRPGSFIFIQISR